MPMRGRKYSMNFPDISVSAAPCDGGNNDAECCRSYKSIWTSDVYKDRYTDVSMDVTTLQVVAPALISCICGDSLYRLLGVLHIAVLASPPKGGIVMS